MSRWHGRHHRGAKRTDREVKRAEALERNQATPRERRRWFREGRNGPKGGQS